MGHTPAPTHTPIPWHLEKHESTYGDYYTWHGPDGKVIDKRLGSDTGKANAALIVRAVNSHAELLQALEDVLDDTGFTSGSRCECSGYDGLGTCCHIKARAALAKAQS